MGKGRINAYFNLPIGDPMNSHSFQGSLSPMKIDEINPMIKHVAFAEIQSGEVNDLDFHAQANENVSNGTMKFGYENLKINLLEKGSDEGSKELISFLANTFVIKSANPLGGRFREGQMHYERDQRKSILNFWWKTILSGFKDTLGVPEKQDKNKK